MQSRILSGCWAPMLIETRSSLVGRRKEELYARAPLLPGVRERLAEACDVGLKTAIVTRNRNDRVKAHCDLLELAHRWDALICANEEPTMDKAGLYRDALAALEVEPDSAVAFEDSPAGVRAGKQAGVLVVAVPNEITRAAAFDEADAVFSSLADHSLSEMLAKVAPASGS
jgi:putative hydrolase of the HAD superfamily